jgi:thymidine phosphorylase
VWRRMIIAQGGDPAAPLPAAAESYDVVASESGVLTGLDAYGVGVAAWRLGAGRARKEDPVSAGAGVICHAKPGDDVVAGRPLLTLYADDAGRFDRALAALDGAIEVRPQGRPILFPLVLDRISA